MTERWHLGTWLGKRFHTGDGLMIRSRAVKVMPEETMLEDLEAIKGSPWGPQEF